MVTPERDVGLPPRRPTVTAIVVTYQRRAMLQRTLPNLLLDPGTDEILVVVNGSTDGTLEWVQELAASEPRLRSIWVRNDGLTGGQRAGVAAATGEVVVLLDDDVLVEPGLAVRHAERHAGSTGVLLVGYMPVPSRRRPGNFTTELYAAEYERVCSGYEHDPATILTHLWMGNVSARRDDLVRIQPFEVGRGVVRYKTDKLIGIECSKGGMRGAFDRSLRATHLHERNVEQFLRQARHGGADEYRIHHLHPWAGSFDVEAFHDDLPRALQWLVKASDDPVLGHVIRDVLTEVTRVTGRAHLWQLEQSCGRLVRRIALREGALEAQRLAQAHDAPGS
jgi:glycosyltransferase involved in cell wall biosynthesis